MKKIITRKFIAERIEDLQNDRVSIQEFGEEMLEYYAFEENYQYEAGSEELIRSILEEFSCMHDYGKPNPGYDVDGFIPTEARLIEISQILLK